MAKDIAQKAYTRAQAEEATVAFIGSGASLRRQLLELFERGAHKALGYTSFEEYAKDRLGMQWDAAYLSKLRTHAAIERNVLGIVDKDVDDSCANVQLPSTSPSTTLSVLPRTAALELAKLPTPEEQRAAYQEMLTLKVPDKTAGSQAKNIVKRRLKALAPNEPAGAPESEAEPEKVPEATSEPATPENGAEGQESASPGVPDEWEGVLLLALKWVRAGCVSGKVSAKYRREMADVLREVEAWVEKGP